ncbi:MAG: hypothetical protein ACLU80_17490 [Dorea sp.]
MSAEVSGAGSRDMWIQGVVPSEVEGCGWLVSEWVIMQSIIVDESGNLAPEMVK